MSDSGFSAARVGPESVRSLGNGAVGRDVRRGASDRRRVYPEDMGSKEPVCPLCGQPVETVVRRRKTLGMWVPVWVPGPCRNPECGDRLVRGPGETGRTRDARSAAPVEKPGRVTAEDV